MTQVTMEHFNKCTNSMRVCGVIDIDEFLEPIEARQTRILIRLHAFSNRATPIQSKQETETTKVSYPIKIWNKLFGK